MRADAVRRVEAVARRAAEVDPGAELHPELAHCAAAPPHAAWLCAFLPALLDALLLRAAAGGAAAGGAAAGGAAAGGEVAGGEELGGEAAGGEAAGSHLELDEAVLAQHLGAQHVASAGGPSAAPGPETALAPAALAAAVADLRPPAAQPVAPPSLDAGAVVATLARLFRHTHRHGPKGVGALINDPDGGGNASRTAGGAAEPGGAGAAHALERRYRCVPQPPHAATLLAAAAHLVSCFKDCAARLHPAAAGMAAADDGGGGGGGGGEGLCFAAWVDEAAWEAYLAQHQP